MFLFLLVTGVLLAGTALGGQGTPDTGPAPIPVFDDSSHLPVPPGAGDAVELHSSVIALPAAQALQAFQDRARRQASDLGGYSDATLVTCELPDSSQRGAFELQRTFVAPRSLRFKAVSFTGATFVKSNVIARVLQSEVVSVEKEEPSQTALSEANYKFSYVGEQRLNERAAHVYQIKPRHKKPKLFKGRIYLDSQTGNLLRSQGTVVKSPSFLIRKIEFVQDWVDVGGYTFPAHLHSTARVRFLGKVVVDVYHREYQAWATAELPVTGHLVR